MVRLFGEFEWKIKGERNVDLGNKVLALMAPMGQLSKQESKHRRNFRDS